jgi:hypothetical protein
MASCRASVTLADQLEFSGLIGTFHYANGAEVVGRSKDQSRTQRTVIVTEGPLPLLPPVNPTFTFGLGISFEDNHRR